MNFKCVFLILLFLIRFYDSKGQAPDCNWGLSSQGSPGESQGIKIENGQNGTSYVLGRFNNDTLALGSLKINHQNINPPTISDNYFIVKIDSSGNVLMLKNLFIGAFSGLFGFVLDRNDNFYISGNYFDSAYVGGVLLHNNSQMYNQKTFVSKFDSNGTLIWVNSNTDNSNSDTPALTVDDSDNVYVFGTCSNDTILRFNTITAAINDSSSYLFVTKFNSGGLAEWIHTMSGTAHGVVILGGLYATDITTDPYNNILITGAFSTPSLSFDSIILYNSHPPGWRTDLYFAKLNSIGQVLWAKSQGSNNSQTRGGKILSDAAGDVLLSGTYSGTCYFDTVQLVDGGSFLAKYDLNGNIIWARTHIGNNPPILGLEKDVLKNIIISGFFAADTLFVSGISIPNDTSHIHGNQHIRLFVFKYDSFGNIIWIKLGNGEADNRSMSFHYPSGIYVTGSFKWGSLFLNPILISNTQNASSIYVAKLNDNFTSVYEVKSEKPFLIYPNPAHNILNILLPPTALGGELRLVDISGRNLRRKDNLSNTELSFEIENLSQGIYFLQLISEGIFLNQKVVIE